MSNNQSSLITIGTGQMVDVCNLDLSVIGDREVVGKLLAASLSKMCRYNGHCNRFYSVAEHCVRVAELLEYKGYGYEVMLAGLLHDGNEAFLSDIPHPLKSLPQYSGLVELEDNVQRHIFDFFDALPAKPVWRADKAMLWIEWPLLMGNTPLGVSDDGILRYAPVLEEDLEVFAMHVRKDIGLNPAMAEHLFLKMLSKLL